MKPKTIYTLKRTILWVTLWATGLCFCVFVFLIVGSYNHNLLDPFPTYPDSTKVTQNLAAPAVFANCIITNDLQNELAFATKDSIEQIKSFYNTIGHNKNWSAKELGSGNDIKRNNILCFEGQPYGRWYPVNAVALLDYNNAEDAHIIAKNFPDAPSATNLILLSQGY